MGGMTTGKGHVLVAMSGGVDSSVAAALLLDAGYDVTGVFLCLKIPRRDEGRSRACCSPQDAEDARRVAETLSIELSSLPVAGAFEPIIDDFVSEYVRGRTPNPCVHCNARIKFGRLFDLADAQGIDYVATGHYARMIDADGRRAVARAVDRRKDQSYALFAIDPRRLDRMLLPVGELTGKAETRAVARQMQLPVHDKPDSQEVCFVPDDDYVSLLAERAPEALRPGPIVDSSGQVLGQHEGYALFTIGQRRGLRVAAGEPMYVTAIDPGSATVTIGPREEVMRQDLSAGQANWHADMPEQFDAVVQIRYNHVGAPARVRRTGDQTFDVHFSEPVAAVTPGQAVVIYCDDRLVGGGWIE
jgi:tRNA-specific 2-thiouridylase